ncbi:glycoside hydrolase family 73 protein [Caulobacter sp. KR2-114]|uniref:glycoside hydrolase family 73 protein n=1 Tax=Caulobacter sp. KR2-114 TaxID=3400912 RepID=UPI003BFC2F5F
MLNPDVIAAARAAEGKWKIPASISLAQYGLESGWGQHMPPGSWNPFGIKALPGQPSVSVPTREFVHGRYILVNAPFRAFASIADAFEHHARLLATGAPYARARSLLPNVEAFANALTGVYATDPHYGAELVAIIHGDELAQYDALQGAAAPVAQPA